MNRAQRFGAAFLLCASFGTGLVAIRVGVGYFPPITFAALRLTAASVSFLILLALTRRRVRRERRFVFCLNVALLGTLSIGLPAMAAAFALRLVSSTLFSILLNLIPVFSSLFPTQRAVDLADSGGHGGSHLWRVAGSVGGLRRD